MLNKPLTDLLRIGVIFVWTAMTYATFCALKKYLIEDTVLALSDFSKTFVIEIDARATGIGVVLTQDSHPVAYLNRALAPRNLGLWRTRRSV